jgi:hypothetical protein
MTTPWFPETVDFYVRGNYGDFYDQVISELIQRKVIVTERGRFFAKVPA